MWDEKSSAAMLVAKRSASVAPESESQGMYIHHIYAFTKCK